MEKQEKTIQLLRGEKNKLHAWRECRTQSVYMMLTTPWAAVVSFILLSEEWDMMSYFPRKRVIVINGEIGNYKRCYHKKRGKCYTNEYGKETQDDDKKRCQRCSRRGFHICYLTNMHIGYEKRKKTDIGYVEEMQV